MDVINLYCFFFSPTLAWTHSSLNFSRFKKKSRFDFCSHITNKNISYFPLPTMLEQHMNQSRSHQSMNFASFSITCITSRKKPEQISNGRDVRDNATAIKCAVVRQLNGFPSVFAQLWLLFLLLIQIMKIEKFFHLFKRKMGLFWRAKSWIYK